MGDSVPYSHQAVRKRTDMHFDIHARESVRRRLAELSVLMASREERTLLQDELYVHLVKSIEPFSHTTRVDALTVGGVDGTGEFPIVAYGDSFVYATVSAGTLYQADSGCGLRELQVADQSLVEFTWLTTSENQRRGALLESFERMTGTAVDEIILGSDYWGMRRARQSDLQTIRESLIIPPAHDAGNIGIQLRTTAELAAALRLIENSPRGAIIIADGTMILPLVHRSRMSLFFEHLRRYCCVRARQRGVVFAALSKSHGLPGVLRLETAAQDQLCCEAPEHWFIRIPDREREGWSLLPADGPQIPPVGAVTYLVRFHRNTPIMRLDLDARVAEAWPLSSSTVKGLLEKLDYAGHDQRCFGYPYPIKAAHDRASLSERERVSLRKQVIDAAVTAGLKRTLFRDASLATGHA